MAAKKVAAKKTAAKKTAAKKMDIRPLADRVLVRRLESDVERTAGGIIVPDTAKEKPQRGKIVAVGPGRVTDDGKQVKPDVRIGDEILFGKYSGTEITVDGQEYLFMRESDILAVL